MLTARFELLRTSLALRAHRTLQRAHRTVEDDVARLTQADLFQAEPALPDGFRYQADIISVEEEAELLHHIRELALHPFEFRGYEGKRRVTSFGWRYDFARQALEPAKDLPAYLLALRDRAAAFAGISAVNLEQALVTEYEPGAPIGWHRDRGVFGDIVGVSLAAACVFRLRRKAGDRWERASITAEPRSAYLLSGRARTEWEHSIPPVTALRYSVTFRTVRGSPGS
jgi:alkylated DNA repair dioxygenase AlkB